MIVGVYLAWLGQPARASEIAEALDMAHETVTRHLRDLADLDLVTKTRHGWVLNPRIIREKSADNPRKMNSTTTSINLLINQLIESEEEVVVESKTADNPRKKRGKSAKNLQTMLILGIAQNERTRALAAREHVDAQYITDHVEAARKNGGSLGLAIVRMENGEEPQLDESAKTERYWKNFCSVCVHSPCECGEE